MDNVFRMGSLYSPAHLDSDTDGFFVRKLPFLFNIGLKRNAFHIFHDDIVHARFTADVVYIDNIRVF